MECWNERDTNKKLFLDNWTVRSIGCGNWRKWSVLFTEAGCNGRKPILYGVEMNLLRVSKINSDESLEERLKSLRKLEQTDRRGFRMVFLQFPRAYLKSQNGLRPFKPPYWKLESELKPNGNPICQQALEKFQRTENGAALGRDAQIEALKRETRPVGRILICRNLVLASV